MTESIALTTDVLRILRTFGPMSNVEVSRHLNENRGKTYRALGILVKNGYAIHLNKQRWAITEDGRALLTDVPGFEPRLYEEAI